MIVRGWGATDVGRKRQHNEDAFLCSDALGLYAVADGMGGHLGGERASQMAVEILESRIQEVFGPRSPSRGQVAGVATGAVQTEPNAAPVEVGAPDVSATAAITLERAVEEADRAIYRAALEDPALAGMGTTLTALLFRGRRVHLGHVGDSRAYLYRDGRVEQITEDHSWIQEQVRAGLLSETEARGSRYRNIITRSVGFEPSVRADMQNLAVQPGDCYLICSDGLSNYLGLEEIGQVLTSCFYRDAPSMLIELANERGGEDNITCVCILAANT